MKTRQTRWNARNGWEPGPSGTGGREADLALVFWSDTDHRTVARAVEALREACPRAVILGCSTGGVIADRAFLENAVCATLVFFERARVKSAVARLDDHADIPALSRALIQNIAAPGLRHVFVLSDGLAVNGCALASGLGACLPPAVAVTGGLAADGERFECTHILHDTQILSEAVTCLGFYGEDLEIGQGTRGGWVPFGPERIVTASRGNILLELDGESALELYRRYLGKHADNLPASGHLFPLHVREAGASAWVVRTILGLDREENALRFGGDIPLGATVRLMRGSMTNLLDGAEEAARRARPLGGDALAILVSCVGRKMLLKQFVEEEIETAAQALGPETALTGFYSYGEIACGETGETSCLHNQTMTITTLRERE